MSELKSMKLLSLIQKATAYQAFLIEARTTLARHFADFEVLRVEAESALHHLDGFVDGLRTSLDEVVQDESFSFLDEFEEEGEEEEEEPPAENILHPIADAIDDAIAEVGGDLLARKPGADAAGRDATSEG